MPRNGLLDVGAVIGLHAQVLAVAELAAWNRVQGLTWADISRALWEDRTLKAGAMRDTLFVMCSQDLALIAGGAWP